MPRLSPKSLPHPRGGCMQKQARSYDRKTSIKEQMNMLPLPRCSAISRELEEEGRHGFPGGSLGSPFSLCHFSPPRVPTNPAGRREIEKKEREKQPETRMCILGPGNGKMLEVAFSLRADSGGRIMFVWIRILGGRKGALGSSRRFFSLCLCLFLSLFLHCFYSVSPCPPFPRYP